MQMGEFGIRTRFAVPEVQGFPLDDAFAFAFLGERLGRGAGRLFLFVTARIRLAVRLDQSPSSSRRTFSRIKEKRAGALPWRPYSRQARSASSS